MRRFIGPLAGLSFLLLIAGCAGVTEDPTKDWSPEKFYTEAKGKVADGEYETGIKYFETLEARYPYGRYAEQAQLEIAYANYKFEEPALAIAAADRFIRLHPTHPNVDYAYYLKGLVNFRGEKNLMNWLLGSKDDLSDRDPKGALESYNAFNEIVTRFPNSRYAADARLRMAYLFEAQAKYETQVARFYFERSAYVAAVNRAKYVLENYPRTPSTEDALGILALSYKSMGLDDLLKDTLRILGKNFPKSRYLTELEMPGPG
ncbi:MAG: outer membrane protein assembly factor BamD [Sulfuricaulis sp.]|nr:outer membrane protein assembly factor BamD [Sulfuricaulis sp.]